MLTKQSTRSLGVKAELLIIAVMLMSCSMSRVPETAVWGTDQTGPCDRLTVVWPLATEMLQDIAGPNFTPADADSDAEGELQLMVMRCALPESKAAPLILAQARIPLAADSVPVNRTPVPDDSWYSLPLTLGDISSPAASLFSRYRFVVRDADTTFELTPTNDATMLHARFGFENGSITVFATVRGEPVNHETATAMVGTGADNYSVFFGKEKANRQLSVSAAVLIEGQTIMSDLNLSETPLMAVFDTQLVSNRIFRHENSIAR